MEHLLSGTLHTTSHSMFTMTLQGKYYSPSYTEEVQKSEVQKDQVICCPKHVLLATFHAVSQFCIVLLIAKDFSSQYYQLNFWREM